MTDSKNCMTDSKENYEFDLGVKGLKNSPCQHYKKCIEKSMENLYTDIGL